MKEDIENIISICHRLINLNEEIRLTIHKQQQAELLKALIQVGEGLFNETECTSPDACKEEHGCSVQGYNQAISDYQQKIRELIK